MKDLTASSDVTHDMTEITSETDLICSKSEKQVCIENWWQLTPYLISLMVSVDVKHNVYILIPNPLITDNQ